MFRRYKKCRNRKEESKIVESKITPKSTAKPKTVTKITPKPKATVAVKAKTPEKVKPSPKKTVPVKASQTKQLATSTKKKAPVKQEKLRPDQQQFLEQLTYI